MSVKYIVSLIFVTYDEQRNHAKMQSIFQYKIKLPQTKRLQKLNFVFDQYFC